MAITKQERLTRAKQALEAFNKRGYTGDHAEIAREDRQSRAKAAAVILSPDDIKGDWDANRALKTTLGGKSRLMTVQDLVVFKKKCRSFHAGPPFRMVSSSFTVHGL